MDWNEVQAVGTIAAVVLTLLGSIIGIVYSAGKISGALHSMAKAIELLGNKFEALFAQTNEHEKKIAVHEERLNQHDEWLLRIEK